MRRESKLYYQAPGRPSPGDRVTGLKAMRYTVLLVDDPTAHANQPHRPQSTSCSPVASTVKPGTSPGPRKFRWRRSYAVSQERLAKTNKQTKTNQTNNNKKTSSLHPFYKHQGLRSFLLGMPKKKKKSVILLQVLISSGRGERGEVQAAELLVLDAKSTSTVTSRRCRSGTGTGEGNTGMSVLEGKGQGRKYDNHDDRAGTIASRH